jgi:hypothetical protein
VLSPSWLTGRQQFTPKFDAEHPDVGVSRIATQD